MLVYQVKFRTEDKPDHWFGGIMVDDHYIICGCCGSVFENDEGSGILEVVKYNNWVDFSEYIQ